MKQKTLVVVLLVALMIFTLVACNKTPKTYAITFKDDAGNLIETVTVEEGKIPSKTWSKPDTVEWKYTFKGWSATQGGTVLSAIPAATADATYFAVVESAKQKYAVTWKDDEGKVISTDNVEYGQTPSKTWTKPNTAEWNYTFKGWSATQGGTVLSSLPAVTANATYFAVVDKQVQTVNYTITWKDDAGNLIETKTVGKGQVPAITWSKPDTAEWKYTLKGWSATQGGEVLTSIPAATADATYFAVVQAEKQKYDITWKDDEGAVIGTDNLEYGQTPSKTWSKSDTQEWKYTFKGWSATQGGTVLTSIPTVSGAATYFAVIEKTKQKYDITWKDDEGAVIGTESLEYGQTPSKTWTKPDTQEWKYAFKGWSATQDGTVLTSIPTVSGAATYFAVVEKTKQKYDITWKDDEGAVIGTDNLEYGQTPSKTWTKPDTQEWKYTFNGWSATQDGTVLTSIPTVSGAATYFAKITKVKQRYTVTFDSNGGSEVAAITEDYGTEIQAPTKPTKEGFRFVCWCSDAELKNKVEFPYAVVDNATLYANWNVMVDMKGFLQTLLDGYKFNPYGYIPETMRATYAANLVTDAAVTTDYTDFVQISAIKNRGFGEQWHMITDNINESMRFFNVLSVVEGLTATSVASFNNYLDQNPSDTANHTFKEGIYNVTINFDGTTMYYVLDYTATIWGSEQSVQIAMALNVKTSVKSVRVQVGEPNALRYEIKENSYIFAIKYLGVRRAYFSVEKDAQGKVVGHINEYLTVSGVGISSAADFYIDKDYATAVGNKASGIPGFSGYISEVYDVKNGKLIGYEVRETLSKIVYNTLWFELSDINGITSIKYRQKTDSQAAAFFVNGSATEWKNKKVGGFTLKAGSRRFDIEFRKQYFYKYDAANETYVEVAVDVPMMFIQEENYNTFAADVKEVNPDLTVSVGMSATHLEKVKSEYATKVDVFIKNKDSVTAEIIIAFIGGKVVFKSE